MSLGSLDEAASAVRVLFLQNYFQLAALILTFYDHALTFGQEVELIWIKRWSKSKILYLLCRYAGGTLVFCDTYIYMNSKPTDVFCLTGMRVTMSIAMVSTWVTQCILQLRIEALYRNKYVTGFLYVLFAGEVVGLFILVVQSMRGIGVTSQPYPGVYQCALTKIPSWILMFWISVLLFDMVLFCLVLRLTYRWWSRNSEGIMPERLFGPSIVFILLRDNFGHCIAAFAVYTVTVIVWLTAEPRYASIPSCFAYSVTTVMGTRLILNLCDAYHNPTSDTSLGGSEWGAVSRFTAVNFAPMPNTRRQDIPLTFRVPLDRETQDEQEDVPADGSKTGQSQID